MSSHVRQNCSPQRRSSCSSSSSSSSAPRPTPPARHTPRRSTRPGRTAAAATAARTTTTASQLQVVSSPAPAESAACDAEVSITIAQTQRNLNLAFDSWSLRDAIQWCGLSLVLLQLAVLYLLHAVFLWINRAHLRMFSFHDSYSCWCPACLGLEKILGCIVGCFMCRVEDQSKSRTCPVCSCTVSQKSAVPFRQFVYHYECFRCTHCKLRVTADTKLILRKGGELSCERCARNGFRPTQPRMRLEDIRMEDIQAGGASVALDFSLCDAAHEDDIELPSQTAMDKEVPRAFIKHPDERLNIMSESEIMEEFLGEGNDGDIEANVAITDDGRDGGMTLSPSAPPRSPEASTSLHMSKHLEPLMSEHTTGGSYTNLRAVSTPLSNPESGRVSPADPQQHTNVFNFSPSHDNSSNQAIAPSANHHVNNPISPSPFESSSFITPCSSPSKRCTSPVSYSDEQSPVPHNASFETPSPGVSTLVSNFEVSKTTPCAYSSPVSNFASPALSPRTLSREEDMLHRELRQLEALGVPCTGLQKIAAALTPRRMHVSNAQLADDDDNVPFPSVSHNSAEHDDASTTFCQPSFNFPRNDTFDDDEPLLTSPSSSCEKPYSSKLRLSASGLSAGKVGSGSRSRARGGGGGGYSRLSFRQQSFVGGARGGGGVMKHRRSVSCIGPSSSSRRSLAIIES